MFLKTESFEHNGVTVTLSELSALQRIEHLALMKRQAEQAESDSNRKFTVEDAIRTGAFLVAMSLWHNHPQKTQMPSMNEAVKQIEQEVLTTWPTEAISHAENVVYQKWNGTAWVKDAEAEKLFRIREAEETKNSLMQVASEHIAPLQDAVDLEIATEEETSLLEAWKKYRVLLNRVDTSTAPDIEWPEEPDTM
ncbi:phage minor tail protein G [Escherichia coli]|nr:phage minor tail protein G [Escherichia coli]